MRNCPAILGVTMFCLLPVCPAQAQDASHCIAIEIATNPATGRESPSAVNRCDHDVFMLWCHDGTGDSACDDVSYYRRGRVMDPGERYFNQFNLPAASAVHAAACKGRKRPRSFLADGSGRFECVDDVTVDGHTHLACGNDAVPYQWKALHRNGHDTFVRLTAGDMIFWTKVANGDFDKFSAQPGREAPASFSDEVCAPLTAEKGKYDRAREQALEFATEVVDPDDSEHDKRVDCQESLTPSEECRQRLRADDPGIGVRG